MIRAPFLTHTRLLTITVRAEANEPGPPEARVGPPFPHRIKLKPRPAAVRWPYSTADLWIRGVFLVLMHYRFEDGKSTELGSGQIAAIARVTTRRETALRTEGNWDENRPRRHYC